MPILGENFYENLDEQVELAIEFFWRTRAGQIGRQQIGQIHDQGNRGAVTGGKQLDGFVDIIKAILIECGLPASYIFTNTSLELPGYYRPNKKWDLLAVKDNRLLAAVELKSQVGPSFGNNFNNRTEEAMGSALDLWTAYREGVLGIHRPWLGYIMVLEECNKSTTPVATLSRHFPIMPEFRGASYKERYEIFCKKLMLERQYTSTCLITTRNDPENQGNYNIPDEDLSFVEFICSLVAHIEASLRRRI